MTQIANIGPRGISRRLKGGFEWLAITGAIGAAAVLAGAPWPAKLLVALPAYRAGLGIFQAKEKTWVVLAARGLRDMDNGLEKVQDEAERRRAMRQAWKVHAESVALAVLVAAVVVIL